MKNSNESCINIDIKYKKDIENWNKLINLIISLILESNNYEESNERS